MSTRGASGRRASPTACQAGRWTPASQRACQAVSSPRSRAKRARLSMLTLCIGGRVRGEGGVREEEAAGALETTGDRERAGEKGVRSRSGGGWRQPGRRSGRRTGRRARGGGRGCTRRAGGEGRRRSRGGWG